MLKQNVVPPHTIHLTAPHLLELSFETLNLCCLLLQLLLLRLHHLTKDELCR